MFAYKRPHIIQNKIIHSSYLYFLFILQWYQELGERQQSKGLRETVVQKCEKKKGEKERRK